MLPSCYERIKLLNIDYLSMKMLMPKNENC